MDEDEVSILEELVFGPTLEEKESCFELKIRNQKNGTLLFHIIYCYLCQVTDVSVRFTGHSSEPGKYTRICGEDGDSPKKINGLPTFFFLLYDPLTSYQVEKCRSHVGDVWGDLMNLRL